MRERSRSAEPRRTASSSSPPIDIRHHGSPLRRHSSEERYVFVRDFCCAAETTAWHLERQRLTTFQALQEVFEDSSAIVDIDFSEELHEDGSGTIVLHCTRTPRRPLCDDGVVYFA